MSAKRRVGILISGSGTNMGGHGILIKTAGESLDEMLLRDPGSLKIAQAGNPERYWYGVARSYTQGILTFDQLYPRQRDAAAGNACDLTECGTGLIANRHVKWPDSAAP